MNRLGEISSLLSPPQRVFVDRFGYPELFIKSFGEKNGTEWVNESWIYVRKGLVEYFVNGVYVEEQFLKAGKGLLLSWEYHPQDYSGDMTALVIVALHGQPFEIREISPMNGAFFERFPADKYYIYDDIIFGFRDGRLASVFPNQ